MLTRQLITDTRQSHVSASPRLLSIYPGVLLAAHIPECRRDDVEDILRGAPLRGAPLARGAVPEWF